MVLSNKKLTRVLDDVFPTPRQAIILLKQQYDNGWLSHIKGYKVKSDYLFWDKQ